MHRVASALVSAMIVLSSAAIAQEKTQLSVGTGGTGGVYYPLGGGIANVLSKHVPGLTATAEVTGGSVAGEGLLLTGSIKSLGNADWGSIALVTLTGAIGIAALAGGFQGWLLRRTLRPSRRC